MGDRIMPFDLNQIPNTVSGTEPQPKLYGKSANQRYFDLTRQAADEFQRSGDAEPLEKVNRASVRYTPKGTIAKGQVTEEAIENAIGYAEGDIEQVDKDADGALSKGEVADFYMQPFVEQLNKLKNTYRELEQDPNATLQQKQQVLEAFEQMERMAKLAIIKAGNVVAATDVPDENGLCDGKLTADELAAKTLFDDAALDMFTDNRASYQSLINALQNKTDDYAGPSFQQLEDRIAEIQHQSQRRMAMDGKITEGERNIADALVDAPIPTNQIIRAIHEGLDLRTRVLNAQQ
jgi:hypothetical protein